MLVLACLAAAHTCFGTTIVPSNVPTPVGFFSLFDVVDPVATSSNITVPPGAIAQSITVPMIGDGLVEFTDSFLVRLRVGAFFVKAMILDRYGVCTILDDEGLATGSRVGTAALTPADSLKRCRFSVLESELSFLRTDTEPTPLCMKGTT